VHIQATDRPTAPGRITEEAQSWSQLAIDPTIAVPDTGMAAYIMSGSLVTGRGGMADKCGSAVIMSREDTKPCPLVQCFRVSKLPSCDQSAQQTEKSANERLGKIVAL
jgi:hypothetical protein